MAKTSLKVKAARKPKFGVRAYTRCNRCGRPHSVYRKSQVPGNRRNRDEEGE